MCGFGKICKICRSRVVVVVVVVIIVVEMSRGKKAPCGQGKRVVARKVIC